MMSSLHIKMQFQQCDERFEFEGKSMQYGQSHHIRQLRDLKTLTESTCTQAAHLEWMLHEGYTLDVAPFSHKFSENFMNPSY